MARNSPIALSDRRRYLAVAILSSGAIGFTAILSLFQSNVFQPYFWNISPPFAVAMISVLGVVSLGFLSSRRWFEICSRRESLRGVAWSSAFATLFAVVVILVDWRVRLPYSHVPPPESLLFYPPMAFVAEIVFHVIPLSVLLATLGSLFRGRDPMRLVWICIVLVSCPEPIFQLRWRSSESPLLWTDVYVGLHVFAFNVLQLSMFQRYDFISMYVCRLAYYIEWHIVWGYLRQYLLPV